MQRRYRRILQWLVMLLSLGYVVHFVISRWQDVRATLSIDAGPLAAVVAIHFLYFVLHALRYHIVLIKCSGRMVAWGTWFRLFIVGRFLNLIVPQLGNVFRAVRLKADHGINYTQYVTSMFAFTWLDTCINLLLAVAIVGLTSSDLHIGAIPAVYGLLMAFAAVAAGPVLLRWVLPRPSGRTGLTARMHARVAELLDVTTRSLGDARFMAATFGLGAAVFGVLCAASWLACRGLGIEAGLAEVAVLCVVLKLATFVTIAPGNLGVLELAFGVLASTLAMGMAEGMVLSAVLRVVRYVCLIALAIPLGGLQVLHDRGAYERAAAPQVEN